MKKIYIGFVSKAVAYFSKVGGRDPGGLVSKDLHRICAQGIIRRPRGPWVLKHAGNPCSDARTCQPNDEVNNAIAMLHLACIGGP